jgi:hypothetical protein
MIIINFKDQRLLLIQLLLYTTYFESWSFGAQKQLKHQIQHALFFEKNVLNTNSTDNYISV